MFGHTIPGIQDTRLTEAFTQSPELIGRRKQVSEDAAQGVPEYHHLA
jgi:hypothetical protein